MNRRGSARCGGRHRPAGCVSRLRPAGCMNRLRPAGCMNRLRPAGCRSGGSREFGGRMFDRPGLMRRFRACRRSYMNRRGSARCGGRHRPAGCVNRRRPAGCRSGGSRECGGRMLDRPGGLMRRIRACRRSYMNRRGSARCGGRHRPAGCVNRRRPAGCRSGGSRECGGRMLDRPGGLMRCFRACRRSCMNRRGSARCEGSTPPGASRTQPQCPPEQHPPAATGWASPAQRASSLRVGWRPATASSPSTRASGSAS